MNRILCTFPGRAGDLLWALPTVRAISEHFQQPVDLQCCGEFAALAHLLRLQPYLGDVYPDDTWHLVPPAEWKAPPMLAKTYWRTFHLGYRGWPQRPLPCETQATLAGQWQAKDGEVPQIDLSRPWIIVGGPSHPCTVAVGFTEYWFELKFGVLSCVQAALAKAVREVPGQARFLQLTMPAGSRWSKEVPPDTVAVACCPWDEAARIIHNSALFFGDCSALHVLAVALGKRCVILEPMVERHNDIFWPLGKIGPVRLVTGTDGLPTTDARHMAEAITEALSCV